MRNLFLAFFVLFYYIICVFNILISFYDEVSNFRRRTRINQKQELVVQIVIRTVYTYSCYDRDKALLGFIFYRNIIFFSLLY